ncbi:MAG TPA: hypothetical protein VG937_30810 [Polyangiaceae bacterium]|nr:hypothetical protein [Polyangiaceae bacterium]
MQLRTSALTPVVHRTPLSLEVQGRARDGAFEILKLSLPPYPTVAQPSGYFDPQNSEWYWESASVRLDEPSNAFAFAGTGDDPQAALDEYNKAYQKRAQHSKVRPPYQPPRVTVTEQLWLRRPASERAVSGTIYLRGAAGQPGHQVPFSAQPKPALAPSEGLLATWARATAHHFEQFGGPFFRFASARMRTRYADAKAKAALLAAGSRRSGNELARLMDTTTGRISIQEALEADRPLYFGERFQKANVPISKIDPPELTRHPWPALLQALGRTPADEPLARATPAEFYFVRARELGKLLDLADVVEDWGQPAADLLDEKSVERGTFARYETELALERTSLGRVLGPSVVSDLALIGSDPYVHEGSDVTVLFRIKNGPLFETALAAALASRSAGHGELKTEKFVEDGVTVQVTRSSDGRVRRHRASVEGIELVSNSPNAMRRVISTLRGHHPRLAEEPDFRYMLARDAGGPDDVLCYMGDRFVEQVVGPAQKIAEARRQLALAELSTPGYAALLYGYLNGASPGTRDELIKANLLAAGELRHSGGAPIDWQPGRAARSAWGSPEALEPLIDLPPVKDVTEAEQHGYEAFAWSYASLWSDKIDPVALRVSETASATKERTLTAELRVLPLLRGEYRQWLSMVGQAKVLVPSLTDGARLVLGIGKDAALREELTRFGHDFIGGERLHFDWIGDYALLGVSNRNELPNALEPELARHIERPAAEADSERPRSFEQTLRDFPVYAVISLRSRVAAGLALTALRQKLSESAPDMAAWGEAAKYRDTTVVKVSFHGFGESAELYYALLPNALALSLNESSLHEAIDQVLEHPPKTPGSPSELASTGQVVLDLAGKPDSALYSVLTWLVSEPALEAADGSRNLAQAVFRGAPELAADPAQSAALMRAYFGAVARTPEGKAYVPAPEIARDPVRGTPYAPIWPALPVPGSPADRVLSQLAALRTEVAFDEEPLVAGAARMQSLRTRVSIKLRR